MNRQLKPWTLNAGEWREENGFTSQDWQMYATNMLYKMTLIAGICLILGIMIGRVI